MLRSYARVFRAPGVTTPMVMSFLGALALNMQGLSVLLLVSTSTGSFARAGTVAAALSIGAAAGLLLQGSLLDRYGHPRVLVPAGVACGALLAVLALAARAGAPLLAMACLAMLAGAGAPAVPSAMRVLCPQLLPASELRTSAYALLAMQLQAVGVLGPLLVSGLLLVARPDLVVVLTGILTTGAAVGYAATRAARRWRPGAGGNGHRVPGSTASPGLRTLLVGGLGVGAVSGLVVVGIPAVAIGGGAASVAGVLLAVASIGNIAGGLVYGSRPWKPSLPHQLVLAQSGESSAAVGLWGGALLLVPIHPLAFAPVVLAGGLAGAPVTVISSTMVDVVANPGTLAQSYTRLIAAVLLGIAAGSYAAGALAEFAGEPSPFAAAAATMGVVAAWTFTRRRTLRSPPSPGR